MSTQAQGEALSRPAAAVLDGARLPVDLIGAKGASLDQLLAWDLPVPPVAVATTDAYRRLVSDPGIDALTTRIRSGTIVPATEVDEAFLAVPFEQAVAADIIAAAQRVGAGRKVAVRSSATIEDLADSSFAGQYRSLLDVDPLDDEAVLRSVRLVFASLWHPAPCAYRRALGVDDGDATMCALFMQMVPALRAGVVFTVDPVGSAATVRIEAVEGLGESLVSGDRTPEVWLVDRDRPEPGLPDDIDRAFRLALVAEARAQVPLDVEWAWDGATLWLVQSRPITVSDAADGDGFDHLPVDEDLTTAGIGEMLPGVLPPLLWELNAHLVEEAFRSVLDGLGVLSGDVTQSHHLILRVRGRAALDFTRLQAMADAIPGSSADELEEQYFGSRRSGRAAAPSASSGGRLAGLVHDLRVMEAARRMAYEGETVIEAIGELAAGPPVLEFMSDAELMAYRLGLLDLGVRSMSAELGVAASATSAYRRAELVLLPHLGAVEAGQAAERVTARSGLLANVEVASSAALFAGPTWEELGLVPPAVGDRQRHGDDPLGTLEQRLHQVASWGAGGLRAAVRTRALRGTVADAVTQLRRREQVKAAVLRLGGEVRRVHQQLGSRLAERGVLEAAQDVELLTSRELTRSIAGVALPPSSIGRRRRCLVRYEQEPPLPVRFRGRPDRQMVALPPGGRVDGWAASSGRFTGRAQVVVGPEAPFESGNVLVAEATDASWSPLFVRAGAVVLERGGPLSHAAILTRELGLPAVLNVQGATQHFDGVDLTVDGDIGVVVVHETEGKR